MGYQTSTSGSSIFIYTILCYILCYLVFIFDFSINMIEKLHLPTTYYNKTIHTINGLTVVFSYRSFGVFNFPKGLGLYVKCLSSVYDKHRGFESLNVPQVFTFQDLSLLISVLHLVIYNTPYTSLLKCSCISPTKIE